MTTTRADIQGLRAIAVAAVLIYHFWPGVLSGGYIGVDVFLVISGYLITAHLLRAMPTTWRELMQFWGRRVRRLLPASAVVIVVTVLASAAVLPGTQFANVAREAIASALYVQNWSLAADATDYLAADGSASGLRHYWSLSVEEQFSFVWPILLAGAVWIASRLARGTSGVRDSTGRSLPLPRRAPGSAPRIGSRVQIGALAVVVLGVLVISLAYSAHLTDVAPAAAYYVTTTRMWELALGGAVALAGAAYPRLSVPRRLAGVVAALGLAGVLGAAVGFSCGTAFPGVAALLPTVGTVLVIVAVVPTTSPVGRLLGQRPVQFLGDVSYSTYLWHWPLVVLVPVAIGRTPVWHEMIALAAGAVGLAWATRRWAEDPVRRSSKITGSGRATFVVFVVCTGAGLAAGGALLAWSHIERERADAASAAQIAAYAECFGAASVLSGADCTAFEGRLWSDPISAAADRPVLYADHCRNGEPFDSREVCEYGPDDADVRIALIGNSHAGYWFPPIEEIASDEGWQVTTLVASGCDSVDLTIVFDNPESGDGCTSFNSWVTQEVVDGDYDLVIMSDRAERPVVGVSREQQAEVLEPAFAQTLDSFTAAGLPVLVLRDTPNFPEKIPDCVAESGPQDCGAPQSESLDVDALDDAAQNDRSGLVGVLDATDVFCDGTECHSVIGGAIAFFDDDHMTASFARTLSPIVGEAIRSALARG